MYTTGALCFAAGDRGVQDGRWTSYYCTIPVLIGMPIRFALYVTP
jgi:hypothetical protein